MRMSIVPQDTLESANISNYSPQKYPGISFQPGNNSNSMRARYNRLIGGPDIDYINSYNENNQFGSQFYGVNKDDDNPFKNRYVAEINRYTDVDPGAQQRSFDQRD